MKKNIKGKSQWPNPVKVAICLLVSIGTVGSLSAREPAHMIPTTTKLTTSLAQTKVTGRVTDQQGTALQGINVQVKGSETSTVTDGDGVFTIQVPSNETILVFSYLGYQSQEVTVGSQRELQVVLAESLEELEEVVVIGYGSVRKKDLTGAVSVVDTREMAKTGSATIAQSIQGLATGVNVRNTGNAGSDASIEIRGVGNLTNNNPLWVIDGLITSAGADFNPNDV